MAKKPAMPPGKGKPAPAPKGGKNPFAKPSKKGC